jgi:hypothetical protein
MVIVTKSIDQLFIYNHIWYLDDNLTVLYL